MLNAAFFKLGGFFRADEMVKILKALFSILIVAVVVIMLNSGGDKKQAEKEAPIDLQKPLVTKSNGLICPGSMLFDFREGHGLAKAQEAHLAIFGRDEAIAKSGCSEMIEGYPITLTEQGKADAEKLEAEGKCWFVASDEGLVYSCSLMNSKITPVAQVPNSSFVQLADAPVVEAKNTPVPQVVNAPPEILTMMEDEEKLNNICRDGKAEYEKACEEREKILAELKSNNWCWGTPDQIMSDKNWTLCNK